MVTIVNFTERTTEGGKQFCTLEVQGDVELIKSQQTGNYYATVRKVSIPTTFDALTCKALIGSQLDGYIKKQSCEPYEYEIKETGETIELSHRYVFQTKEEKELDDTPSHIKAQIESFSKNGVH